jgi:hypothetical protein
MKTDRSHALPLNWFKSSYSGGEGGECVEIASAPSAVHVRDSKNTGEGGFAVTPGAWTAFLGFTRRS